MSCKETRKELEAQIQVLKQDIALAGVCALTRVLALIMSPGKDKIEVVRDEIRRLEAEVDEEIE